MSLLAELAPLAGRLAFAAVFLPLIIWLILIPKRLLGEEEPHGSIPIWRQVRSWAIVIAAFQLLIYLFWN